MKLESSLSDITKVRELPSRTWAHPFDRPVKLDIENRTHGVGASPDALGGFYGIGWYETFRDHKSGEIYSVHCSDGVYGGNSSHQDCDIPWMRSAHRNIIARTIAQAGSGANPITLSSSEWAIMLGFGFVDWLDLLPGEEFKTVGDRNRHLDEGQIGTIEGTPVVVDPSASDDLEVGVFSSPVVNSPPDRVTGTPTPTPTKFSGVFADALRAVGFRC